MSDFEFFKDFIWGGGAGRLLPSLQLPPLTFPS